MRERARTLSRPLVKSVICEYRLFRLCSTRWTESPDADNKTTPVTAGVGQSQHNRLSVNLDYFRLEQDSQSHWDLPDLCSSLCNSLPRGVAAANSDSSAAATHLC
jgi:hypothetical protein